MTNSRFSRVARLVVSGIATMVLTNCGGFFPSSNTIVSLSLSPTGAWIKPQATQQFTATATFGNNKTGGTTDVTWSSSSTSVATIDSSGKVTAVTEGTATITAKSNNSSATATAPLTVSSKTITSVSVSPQNVTLTLAGGRSQQYTATLGFSDGSFQNNVTTGIAWNSSDTTICTVSSGGLASPVTKGSVTISASAGGQTGTSSLTIN